MAHVQIKRVPDESPWSNGGTRWAVLVDGVDLAHSLAPDGLRLEFDPERLAFKVGLTLHADRLDADLPDSVLEALAVDARASESYVAEPADCGQCVRAAAARATAARDDEPLWPY